MTRLACFALPRLRQSVGRPAEGPDRRRLIVLTASLLLSGLTDAAELCVGGGQLRVDARLQADRVVVEANSVLRGTGTLDAACTVRGTVAPGADGASIGTLSFTTTLVFEAAAVYACQVESNTGLDRLTAGGTVGGTATVALSKTGVGTPVDQVAIAGASASDYAHFAPASPASWRLTPDGAGSLTVTDLVGDSDGDALPDWWEMVYFGGRTGALPGADADFDGAGNSHECLAGTDPTNAGSVFAITDCVPGGSNSLIVGWLSVSGRLYGIEASTNLAAGECGFSSLATNLAATPPANSYTDWPAIVRRYYRVSSAKPQ